MAQGNQSSYFTICHRRAFKFKLDNYPMLHLKESLRVTCGTICAEVQFTNSLYVQTEAKGRINSLENTPYAPDVTTK